MVDKADVYVKNKLTGDISGDIRAIRYCLPGDNSDLDITINPGNEEMIHLVRTESYLVIKALDGVDPADCSCSVSNEELLSCEPDDHWKVEIKPNNLQPTSPTTANVDVGPKET